MWVVLSVNYVYKGKFSQADTWESFSQKWLSQTQSMSELGKTSESFVPKLMSIESVMSSNRLILCHPLLLLPSIFPSIMAFSNESALYIRWPKY